MKLRVQMHIYLTMQGRLVTFSGRSLQPWRKLKDIAVTLTLQKGMQSYDLMV